MIPKKLVKIVDVVKMQKFRNFGNRIIRRGQKTFCHIEPFCRNHILDRCFTVSAHYSAKVILIVIKGIRYGFHRQFIKNMKADIPSDFIINMLLIGIGLCILFKLLQNQQEVSIADTILKNIQIYRRMKLKKHFIYPPRPF